MANYVSNENDALFAMWQQAAAALAEQSAKIDSMEADNLVIRMVIGETEDRSSNIKAKTTQLIRSMTTPSFESHNSSPLGLCLQLMTLKDCISASRVCRAWHRVSSDYAIQIEVWSNHLRIHNPEIYDKYYNSNDKRFLVIAGRNFYQVNHCKKKDESVIIFC